MPAATSASGAKPAPKKGILKKTKAATSATEPTEQQRGAIPPDEARQVAIRHATIIQQQKAIHQKVLDHLIELSEHPRVRGAGHSAASPAASDVAEFKAKVRTFQPTDYDDLIEERNVNDLCGYALCPKPRKRYGPGTFKAVNQGRPDFKIMPIEELEKWCSQDCARRALYVKVQLNETAAWERIGIPDIEIELMGEKETGKDSELAADIGRLKMEEEKKAEKSSTLALERGDTTEQSKGSTNLVDFTIREKKTTAVPEPPSLEAEDDDEGEDMLLEGYKPRFR